MLNFSKLSDKKLLDYVWLWENCPSTKLLINKEIYDLAIEEMKLRGLANED